MANVRELKIGFGYRPQSALQTANVAADLWSLSILNDQVSNVELVTEDDANWLGKGHEFASQVYLSHWNVNRAVEKFVTSQFMAHLGVFGLGTVTKTSAGTGAYKYSCTPSDPVANDIDMKPFTFVEAIRQGASAVFDRALVGCVWDNWQVTLAPGPGLANSKATGNLVGCGKYIEPSELTIPATRVENLMPASSMAVTINGVNYVTAKNLISLEYGWNNAPRMDSGFYPGCGTQDSSDGASGAIRGRLEHGDRSLFLRFVARFKNGSTELSKLRAQTEGTAAVKLTGSEITTGVNHEALATWHRTRIKSAVLGNTDGIVSVAVEIASLYHSSNGLFTLDVTTDQDNIGVAA